MRQAKNNDFLDELQELALGSRLKRLSDRMMSDAAAVYKQLGFDLQPKWFTLLALLYRKKEVSVVQAAQYLGLSQPAISQFASQLVKKGIISSNASSEDARRRFLTLTPKGTRLTKEMQPLWQAVESAAQELCREAENDFYNSIKKCEAALNRKSLLERSLAFYHAQTTEIEFIDYRPALRHYFKEINEQWITKMFTLEAGDRSTLDHPEAQIINRGGRIWFAKHKTLGIIGTCALLKKDGNNFELTKMGVMENARGLKVGERLLKHILQEVDFMKLDTLFLLTNKLCEAAIHLYEKNGFVHSKEIMTTYGSLYKRCNVAMLYVNAARDK